MSDAIIRLENVELAYPGSDKKILNRVSLDIGPGDRIGMIAPNGEGKTTLLHAIMGLCLPQKGSIQIFGRPMETETDFSAIRSRVGLLFQDSDDQLFCPTVLDDVAFGPLNLGFTRQQALDKAYDVLAELDIIDLDQSITHRLSGGQKRLVALAAVLAMEPEVLLLDEPTAGLDQGVKRKLVHILADLSIPYFVISHEFDFITAVADRILDIEAMKKAA